MARYKKTFFVFTSVFPPTGGSGCQRIVKFVKYLDKLDWQSYVLSVDMDDRIDISLVDEIPEGTKVYRKKKWVSNSSTGHIIQRKISLIKKIINKLRIWVLVPQRDILSVLSLLPLGKRVIISANIKIILATIPSFSIAIGACFLKRMTNVRLVLDFRDPWADSNIYDWGPLKRRIQRVLQDWTINSADVIISNTKELERVFKSRYPEKRIVTINNGYDRSDYPAIVNSSPSRSPITFIHAGEFYPQIRNPRTLLIALGELLEEGKINPSIIRVDLVGGGDIVEEDEFIDLMKRYGLHEIVYTHDFMAHNEALKKTMMADVLLLMQNSPKARLQIPAKVFEYLYIKKPILSLSPDGATSNIIRETDSGFVVNPENIGIMKEKIMELISLKKRGKLNSMFTFRDIEKFDRKQLALRLSEIFDSLY